MNENSPHSSNSLLRIRIHSSRPHLPIFDWWTKHKVTNSPGQPAGRGQLHNGRSLFLPNAKTVHQEARKNCEHLQDPFDMHKPTARQSGKHGLTRWRTERGESTLEKINHLLANFANPEMRPSLADALSLWNSLKQHGAITVI